MKTISQIINIILILFFFTLTKEDTFDPCPSGYISVSALGKCISIVDLLNSETLELKTQNLLYLASNNEGKINKDNYKLEIYKLNDTKLQSHNMKKSKLYIPNTCLNQMEVRDDIKLQKNKGIVIIVYNSNNLNKNRIPDIYFIIRHDSDGSEKKFISSKTFDLSFCNKDPILFEDDIKVADLRYKENDATPIDVNKILYGRKNDIDLFDYNSDFLNDICFEFRSEKGTDVTLDSRLEDYYQNITFCDDKESSHYMAYNYSSEQEQFTYRCAFGFYKSLNDKNSYLDKIDNQIKSLVSVSNIKVIKCYKNFLNLKDIIRNYGGMICIFVLIVQIICFLLFCFRGVKSLEDKLLDLFIAGKVMLRRLGIMVPIFGINDLKLDDKRPKKLFNLWGKIKAILLRKKKEREAKLTLNKKGSNPPTKSTKKKSKNSEKGSSSESKKIKKKKTLNIQNKKIEDNTDDAGNIENKEDTQNKVNGIQILDINPNEVVDNNDNKDSKEEIIIHKTNKIIEEDDKMSEKSLNNKKDNNSDDNIYNRKDDKNLKDKTTDGKKIDTPEIYERTVDEINELPLKDAKENDKRGFCRYYWDILKFSHIILNLILRWDDFNIFTVKLGLLFMTFPINLTFNIFFFTNKKMKINYANAMKDISLFWSNIANSVYSSILSNVLLIILKFICLSHNSIRSLKKIDDINLAQKKSEGVLRCIKARIIIYYILSFIFLIIFGYYILCFCSVFENTQIELVRSTFTSWLISLLYPFIICFFTSIIRALSFKCNSQCLHFVKRIMQML